MSDDYERDYDDGLHGRIGNTMSPGYTAGQAAAERAEEAAERRARTYQEGARNFASNPVRFTLNSLVQGAVITVGVGALGGLWAAINGRAPLDLAVPAAAIAAGLCLVVYLALLAGLLLGFAWAGVVSIVALPFVLWRWLVVGGAVGAALGYFVFAPEGGGSNGAQRVALEDALIGLGIGFAIGAVVRIGRAIMRRGRRGAETAS